MGASLVDCDEAIGIAIAKWAYTHKSVQVRSVSIVVCVGWVAGCAVYDGSLVPAPKPDGGTAGSSAGSGGSSAMSSGAGGNDVGAGTGGGGSAADEGSGQGGAAWRG